MRKTGTLQLPSAFFLDHADNLRVRRSRAEATRFGTGDERTAMKQWRARAPVRFCDLGGWTDTRIVPRGAVLNFAARLYTYVTLSIREGPAGFELESLDTDERVSFHDLRQVEYDGVLDLLKAAVSRSGIE